MRNVFRQFGAKGIGLFNDRYTHSIYKLTFLYAAILAAILIISSGVIYQAFSNRIDQRYRKLIVLPKPGGGVVVGDLGTVPAPQPSRDQVKADLIYALVLVNGVLLIVAAGLSYWLAKNTLRPLRDSYDRQRNFMADASHELRTPLSVLKLELENTIANTGSTTAQQAVSHLEEVDRMTSMVNDMLLLSRIGEDGAQELPKFSRLSLSTIVNDVVHRLEPLAAQYQVTMSAMVPDDAMVSSNEALLVQIFNNTIKNAIVYNTPGGWVRIAAERKNKQIVVTIADSGIGIPKEDLDKVFDRFYRSDKSRSRAHGGSGLGLAIVRSAVEQLRGSIRIESTVNEGTRVTVVLPV